MAKALAAGDHTLFPKWYPDDVTDAQRDRMRSHRIPVALAKTKGQASDLIGLFEEPHHEDISIIKFFKVPTKGLNQTVARIKVAALMSDEENAAAWENRPATPMQREFYRFFSLKAPPKLTAALASEFIRTYSSSLEDEIYDDEDSPHDYPPDLQRWEIFEELWDELGNSPYVLEEWDMKRPSLAAFRSAIHELEASGTNLLELEADTETVADKLLEMNPNLARSS